MFTVKESSSQEQFNNIVALRFKLLREPWKQPYNTSWDTLEEKSCNAYIEAENKTVIACGRLQENENKIGQIRYMAVEKNYQGQGFGKLILDFLEKKAKETGLEIVQLQARENAVAFYENNGYTIKEKSFLLWGLIQHYLMEKNIQ